MGSRPALEPSVARRTRRRSRPRSRAKRVARRALSSAREGSRKLGPPRHWSYRQGHPPRNNERSRARPTFGLIPRTGVSTSPDVEDRMGVMRDLAKGRRIPEALRWSVAANDENDPTCMLRSCVTCRLAREPVEVEALVGVAERIERIAHPDTSPGQCYLLCWDALGQDRRPGGLAERLVEERFARARRQRPAHHSEHRQRDRNRHRNTGYPPLTTRFEVQASGRWSRREEQEPDAAASSFD